MGLKDFFKTHDSGVFHGPFLFSIEHILFIVIAIASIVIILIRFRNASEKGMRKFLFIVWIVLVIAEVVINLWEIVQIKEFKHDRMMPLYPCSTFMYLVPIILFSKNEKLKQACLAYISTFTIFGGLINFFIPPMLNKYPVFSMAAMHSLLYHYVLVLAGLLLWFTKFYKHQKYDFLKAYLVHIIFALPIMLLDKLLIGFAWNYFWLNSGGGTPLDIIGNLIPFHWLWTFVMFNIYFLQSLVMFLPAEIIRIVKQKRISRLEPSKNIVKL